VKEPIATPSEVAAILAAYRAREAASSPASSATDERQLEQLERSRRAEPVTSSGTRRTNEGERGAPPTNKPNRSTVQNDNEKAHRSTSIPTSGERAKTAHAKPRSKHKRARRASFLASLEARGARGCRPRDIPSRAASGAIAIRSNRTGAGARHALEHHFPTAWRGPLWALALDPGDGRRLPEDLSHEWSRWVIACAFLLWKMRRRSLRNGACGVVDGITQGMICGLFKNARGRSYSRSRLFATSYRRGTRECGPMTALVRAGLCWRQQPRESEANPRFIGPPRELRDGTTRRFAFAITWLVLPLPPD